MTRRGDEVLDLAKKLIEFNTSNPPGNEGALAAFVCRFMENLGLQVSTYEVSAGRPVVVGVLRGGREGTIVFNGHSDVVPAGAGWTTPPFEPIVREGHLHGRGSADMKGGLAAMLVAVAELTQVPSGERPTVQLHVCPDEEDTGSGAIYLVERGLVKAAAAVFGEPTNLQVQIAHKGAVWMKAEFRGKSAHASVPNQGVNAVYKATSAIHRLLTQLQPRLDTRTHKLLGGPSFNVGLIQGGTRVNTVPDRCEFAIDRRVLPGEDIAGCVEEMRSILGADSLRVEHVEEPMEIAETEEIVAVARGCVREITGHDRGIAGFPASTDARFYVNQAHVPSIILGPGSISTAHAADERVSVTELEQAVDIYFGIARRFQRRS